MIWGVSCHNPSITTRGMRDEPPPSRELVLNQFEACRDVADCATRIAFGMLLEGSTAQGDAGVGKVNHAPRGGSAPLVPAASIGACLSARIGSRVPRTRLVAGSLVRTRRSRNRLVLGQIGRRTLETVTD